MNGSVISPMNMFIALNVVCCEPVAASPETCVRPAGVSVPNTSGMPPVVLKKLISALATFCWLLIEAAAEVRWTGGVKFSSRLR